MVPRSQRVDLDIACIYVSDSLLKSILAHHHRFHQASSKKPKNIIRSSVSSFSIRYPVTKMYLNPRYKLPVHVVYIVLVTLAMGLSVPRLFMKSQPRTRANTIALGMVSGFSITCCNVVQRD